MKYRSQLVDLAGISGGGLLSYGAWLIYQPLGFIACGALLLLAAWLLGGEPGSVEGGE